ncbi:predicted protein [Arabidopsis lyrata subsp. lyrata]|uniref:Predicted protein n=1 Tax=Arabidopsis lyrata subsp. lyrata TaxID=81972 RepID=D7LKZ5_ARALL|nr:predicted protein [Arabidopsis lyrata subsp. lyrata]
MGQANVRDCIIFSFRETKGCDGPAMIWTVGDALQEVSQPLDSNLRVEFMYFFK